MKKIISIVVFLLVGCGTPLQLPPMDPASYTLTDAEQLKLDVGPEAIKFWNDQMVAPTSSAIVAEYAGIEIVAQNNVHHIDRVGDVFVAYVASKISINFRGEKGGLRMYGIIHKVQDRWSVACFHVEQEMNKKECSSSSCDKKE